MSEYSLGSLIVNIGAELGSSFTSAMTDVKTQLTGISETADTALAHFDGLFAGLGELAAAAGIATGAFEIAKEALGSFSKAQDIQTSFALLTGSTEAALTAFEGLKETAIELAIPFEELVSVSQKLAPQFGVGTQALKDVTTAAADAAAATGRSFTTIAEGLDRIAITGQVSTRQMVQFGVSMSDIAKAMGVSVDEAIKLLKKGGQDAQADVDAVVTAIKNKFGGAAEAIGQNLSGQFTKLKNELAFLSEDLGKALAPLAEDLIVGLKAVEPVIKSIIEDGIKPFVDEVQTLFKDIKDGAASIGDTLSSGDTLAGGQGWIADQIDGIKSLISEYKDLDGEIKAFGSNLKLIADQTGYTALVENSSEATRGWVGEVLNLKNAFDLLFPEFGQLTDLLKVLNFALDSYQGKVKEMAGPTNDLGTSARGLSDAWKDAGMSFAVTQSVYDKARGYFGDTTKSIYGLSDAFKDLGVKVPPTQAEFDKLANAMDFIQKQFDDGKISSQTYGAAVDDFVKKMNSLQGAFVAASQPVDLLGQALKLAGIKDATDDIARLQAGVEAAGEAYSLGRISAGQYADEITKLDDVMSKNSSDTLPGLITQLKIAAEDFALFGDTPKALAHALDAVVQAGPAFQDAILKQAAAIAGLNVSMDSVTQATPNVEQILRHFGVETADDVTSHIARLQAALYSANAAMRLGVPGAALAAQLALQGLRQEQQKLSEEALDDKILGIPNLKSLRDKLKDVNKAYEDLASNGLLTVHQAMEAEAGKLRDQIQLGQQLGQNTDELQLKYIHLADAIRTQNEGFTQTVIQMHGVINSGLQNALDDLIFKTGDVGKAFQQMGESIVTTFANRILNDALKPVLNELDFIVKRALEATEKLLHIPVPGQNNGNPDVTTPPFAGGKIPGIGGSGGGGGGEQTSSGGGAAGSALGSSIAPVFGMVTGAISAITGVIDVFQNMHQETSLNAIESNTRVGALYTLACLQQLQAQSAFDDNSLFPEIAGINSMLMTLVNGGIAAQLTPKGPDFSVYNSDTFGQINATLGNILDQLQGQVHADMTSIQSKLDVLNQSVVAGGASGGTGTFSVNGVTQTIKQVGAPIQMVSDQPAKAPTWSDMVNGVVGAAPWKAFVDAMSQSTSMIDATLTSWLGTVNTSISTSNAWLGELAIDVRSGFNTVVMPRMDQIIQSMAKAPSITVNINAPTYGITDLVNQIQLAIAANIRAQGCYA